MSFSLLALCGRDHDRLRNHLLPADGLEAAAILLCTISGGARPGLFVRSIILVPYLECGVRERDALVWPGQKLAEAQAQAEDEGLAMILIHSHPGGMFQFSHIDDASDLRVLAAARDGWCGSHPATLGSAIMVPDGSIRARTFEEDGRFVAVEEVRVAGDEIKHISPNQSLSRQPMAFGDGMGTELRHRRACVVGVSGTGSIIAEQAARLGFGGLVLIDFDTVEDRNLNRILNSTLQDAALGSAKVDMFARAVRAYRPDIEVVSVKESILSRGAVLAAAGCDVIFSCVDSSEGRQVADLVAQAFLIPLVDMGVTIFTRQLADGGVAVADAVGRIDYVQPGASSLLSRCVYTPDTLRAEYLARVDPTAHAAEVAEGYIKGAPQEAPAVISLNMRAASEAMLEYLARSFPYRHEPASSFARSVFRLGDGDVERFGEASFPPDELGLTGAAAQEPLLGMPGLCEP
ncbi:ThiF family adenylyltransferase [Sphingomonas sp. Ant20]|uniref:ThiF family adenylyltransferase n=1 Tax=Sphingomonas sp. Ant20 TaxID=104605 RepID=UPI0005377F87|nr:ThiF family adenylyltransferase [Sphingomonas sp. Ant20]KHA64587.1 thiamine biosynthesis protein ThiF [Sphingomonas sp. Ant20]